MSEFLITPDNCPIDSEGLCARIEEGCDVMEQIYADGAYPLLTVERNWSMHNPVLSGEFARPEAYRWYLLRELGKMIQHGARVKVSRSRDRVSMNDPMLLESIDEEKWDITRKKLFLFAAERIELSIDRLEHYTGTHVKDFQRHILLTNYQMYMDLFKEIFPDAVVSEREGVQMPAAHAKMPGNRGITIINIGVGPSNAKTATDHLAVLRPDAMIMVGHCGGVRNHQEVGDFVLASSYMRADHVLDALLPIGVPIAPTFLLNRYLSEQLDQHNRRYRAGTVYTTADRNWELAMRKTREDLRISRSIGIDMESATVAANGFRYRIPNATLLCVSDKPLHGSPKLSTAAKDFYEESKGLHLKMAIAAVEQALKEHPEGLPNLTVRGSDEPLLGGPDKMPVDGTMD